MISNILTKGIAEVLSSPFRSPSSPLVETLSKPRRRVLDVVFGRLSQAHGLKSALAICILLAFIPLTLGRSYVVEHDFVTSILLNSTQLALVIVCFGLLLAGRLGFSRDTGWAMLCALSMGLLQILAVWHNHAEPKNYRMPVGFVLLLCVGPVVHSMSRRVNIADQGRYVRAITNALLCFFTIECVTRFIVGPSLLDSASPFTDETYSRGEWIYKYKLSLFFGDSNYAGLALLCLLALLFAFRSSVSTKSIVFGYLLLSATLSRACIIAGLCQLGIYSFWRWRRWLLGAVLLAGPATILFLLNSYVTQGPETLQSMDRSFASKFFILREMSNVYFGADDLLKVVGIGSGNTEGLIGIAAHDIAAVFLLEFGLAGSALALIYLWLLARNSPKAVYLLMVPVLVAGFAAIQTSIPYFYVALGVLGALKEE